MQKTQTVSVSLKQNQERVYRYLSDPENTPTWSLFIQAISQIDGTKTWRAKTKDATVEMRFSPENPWGILDHWVRINETTEVYVPFRVVANGEGSEVLFTVFRQPGMTDQAFADDLAMVTTDLAHLKEVLEKNVS